MLKRYWANATQAPFATALALLAISGGVRAMVDPNALPVEAELGMWSYVWGALFAGGGLAMLYGMTFLKPRWEAAGCVAFAGGSWVEALAFFAALPIGFVSIYSVVNLGLFGVFALVRAKRIRDGEHLIWIRTQL